jgi:tight adherence protein C
MLAETNLVIAMIPVCAGVSVALMAMLLGKAIAAIPAQDRRYMDMPPLGFKLMWWPIQWCSHVIRPLLSAGANESLTVRLRKAGLAYSIAPAQFLSARLLCAAAVAACACWLLVSFAPLGTGSRFKAGGYAEAALVGALCGWAYPAIWLKDRTAARKRTLQKTLPFYLDLITLCVEAGLNLQGALTQAVDKGPKGILQQELQRVLRDIRNGKARADALRAMSDSVQEASVTNFVTAMIQAERLGMNLGPVLRAQADQRRSERFLRAEKLAIEAPVKLLFPLIAFIFPCTFIVLFFPIVIQFMQSGL